MAGRLFGGERITLFAIVMDWMTTMALLRALPDERMRQLRRAKATMEGPINGGSIRNPREGWVKLDLGNIIV